MNGIDPATPLTATVDMLFITGPNRTYSGWLRDAHTLPARPGDKVRVEVRISANAFCYVFAISAGGKVVPLYPWTDRKWSNRPVEENPVRTVFAPPDTPGLKPKEFNVWTITAAERGMESVVAILRTERWELPDEKIEALFAGLEPNFELANEKAFVAFDNGAMVRTTERTRDYDGSNPQNAPNLQIQNIIARKLQPYAVFTTAVSFAKVEK